MTDIHSGWTECATVVVGQTLVVEGIRTTRRQLPFVLRGLDDSVFDQDGQAGSWS